MIIMMIYILFSLFLIILALSLFRIKKNNTDSFNTYSLIIACRNEETTLPKLFTSLSSLEYSDKMMEIILVDDHSTDQTFSLLQQFSLKNASYHALRNTSNAKGKKYALQKGFEFAQGEFVVLTDADCFISSDYLKSLNHWIDRENNPDMLIGYSPEFNAGKFRHFSQLITATIFAVTATLGSPMSCTGRNLVIKRKTFLQLKGYQDLFDHQSGDDKLLLNKFIKNNKKVSYFPEPKIETMNNLSKEEQKNQDRRRFGKFKMSRLPWQIISLLVVIFYITLPLVMFQGRWGLLELYFLSALLLVLNTCRIHKERFHFIYLLFILLYPYYLIVKSIEGSFKSWEWK